jgi:NAD(P)H-quinone oxidoreductase subunit 5
MDTLLETLTVMHSEAPLSWLPLILIIVPAILLVAGGVYAWEGCSRKLRAEHAPRATLSALILSLLGTGGLFFTSPDSSIVLSTFTTPFGMRLDFLASTMAVLVTFIGHVIVKYSVRYLNGEHRQKTFLSWLFFSLASVLTLSLSGNLLLLTAAWIATSLTFHKLLTYYTDRPEAIRAARKKFVISRIGDLSLLGAILLCWNYLETCDLGKIANMITQSNLSESQTLGLTMVSCLIITAAVLKSAQFPFHSWLPETMETPTPVSALMHAGMINGGGFLIIRCSHLLVQVPAALTALAVIGLMTGIYGSLIMLTQTSVKRSLAYSTVAQMGFMMIQCGFGAFGLAYVHLIGHAIYKAHAFLASGTLPVSVKPNLKPKKANLYELGTFVGALVFGPLLLLTLNHWTGIPLSMTPGNVLLTSVLFMSWSILVFNWWRAMDDGLGFFKTIGLGAGVIGLYTFLHLISHETFTGTFPVDYSQGSWQTYSLVAVLVAILMMTAFGQILLPHFSSNHWIRKLYVHSSRGFYIAVIADKWIARLYKDRTFSRPSRTSKAFYESDLLKPQQLSKYEYDVVNKMVEDTADKMAPLWPLKDFVAVNPFLGFVDNPYVATCEYVRNLTPGGMQMAANYYQDKIKSEKITVNDLERGIRRAADYNHLLPPGFLVTDYVPKPSSWKFPLLKPRWNRVKSRR